MVICGESAANPKCAYLYLGMGIQQLSMNAPSVPIIKHLMRNVKKADAEHALMSVLLMDDADEIENFIEDEISPALKGVTNE
jgi:phosphoenolpyruvate-protein kinase (PTS system EI component)